MGKQAEPVSTTELDRKIDELTTTCRYAESPNKPNYCRWCGEFKLANIHLASKPLSPITKKKGRK